MTGNIAHPRRSLWTALVGSLVIHASAGAVIDRETDRRPLPTYAPSARLAVRLMNAANDSQTLQILPKDSFPAARADDAEPAGVTSVAPAIERVESPSTATALDTPPGVAADSPARRATGSVEVSADATLARVGWFLESRSRTEFPVEVKEPVRIGEALHFAYPADALMSRREGAVLAWLMVDAEGAVAELNIISGDDDFSIAVADALAAARFLPATDLYDKPIPFYTVLEFDFRIDRAGATGADDMAVSVTTPPK